MSRSESSLLAAEPVREEKSLDASLTMFHFRSLYVSYPSVSSPTHNITARTSVTVLWSPYYSVGVRFSYVGGFKGVHVRQLSAVH